ncbi:MAG: hypothetical protein L0323_14720 [Planctomycetes bacterium]|nr:hypothetical protein [Planctomycetota bacterium]
MLGGGYFLLLAAALTFVLGVSAEAPAQTITDGGLLPIVPTPVPLALGPGVTNTGQVGAFPAVWNVDVAFITSEVESGQDLDCNPGPPPGPGCGLPADPIGGVVQILDLDAQVLTNTTVPGLSDPLGSFRNTLTITEIGTGGAIFAAWISREDQLFNLPYIQGVYGLDRNADMDTGDWVVVLMAYKNAPPPTVPGWTWVLAPPASPGLSSGFIGVHMNGDIMVIEQGASAPLPPPSLPMASVPPLPILVLDLLGFVSPVNPPPGILPSPFPIFVSSVAGYNPKANFRSSLLFPQTRFIVFEQREADLGASFNPDGDLCDRVVAFREIINTPVACCPLTISVTLSGVCLMGVGNFPSTRPDPTFGQYVGFDVIPAFQQPTVGPDCPIPPGGPFHSHRGRANPTSSAPCGSGYSLGNDVWGERVSVAGINFVHVVRESAPGVGDINGDGWADDGVVVGFDQSIWPPTYRWRYVAGPGNNPAVENAFNFVINPPPGGPYFGLIAYEGWEAYQGLGPLNGDPDQGDRVIQIRLNN